MSKQEEYVRIMEEIHDELPNCEMRDVGLGIQIKHMLLTLSRQIVELANRCAACGGDCSDANYCVGDNDD